MLITDWEYLASQKHYAKENILFVQIGSIEVRRHLYIYHIS